MATMTIPAPVRRRTHAERHPVVGRPTVVLPWPTRPVPPPVVRTGQDAHGAPSARRALGGDPALAVRIPAAATLYAASAHGAPAVGVRTLDEHALDEQQLEPAGSRPVTVPRGTAPVRLTRRGRRLARTAIVLAAMLAAFVVSIAGHSATSSAGDGPATPATTTVVVQPGQTLWQVARAVAPDADVRDTIARIQDLNGLTGPGAATVRPGQSLVVPIAG